MKALDVVSFLDDSEKVDCVISFNNGTQFGTFKDVTIGTIKERVSLPIFNMIEWVYVKSIGVTFSDYYSRDSIRDM